jgi:hypothetical protein
MSAQELEEKAHEALTGGSRRQPDPQTALVYAVLALSKRAEALAAPTPARRAQPKKS